MKIYFYSFSSIWVMVEHTRKGLLLFIIEVGNDFLGN